LARGLQRRGESGDEPRHVGVSKPLHDVGVKTAARQEHAGSKRRTKLESRATKNAKGTGHDRYSSVKTAKSHIDIRTNHFREHMGGCTEFAGAAQLDNGRR
jgi:hypothetical protein